MARRVHEKLAKPEAGVEVDIRGSESERGMVRELQSAASSTLGKSRSSCFIGGAGTIEARVFSPATVCDIRMYMFLNPLTAEGIIYIASFPGFIA